MEDGYPVERNGAVAVLDVLGMKEIGRSPKYRDYMVMLRDRLHRLKESAGFHEQLSGWLNEAGSDLPQSEREVFGFQDTFIVCYWPSDPATDLRRILSDVSLLLGPFIADAMGDPFYPFFFRGAVEIGRFSVWDGLVFGEAFVESFVAQDQSQWAGVSAGPKASALLAESKDDAFQPTIFFPFPIPMKGGKDEPGFGLSWPNWVPNRDLYRGILKKLVDKHARPDIRAKYQNTLAFAEACWQKYPLESRPIP